MIKEILIDGVTHEIGVKAQNVEYANTSNVKETLDGLSLGVVGGRNLYNSSDTTQKLVDYKIDSDGKISYYNNLGTILAKIPCEANTDYIVYNADGIWGDNRLYGFYDKYSHIIGSVKNWTVDWNEKGGDAPIDEKHRRVTTPNGCAFLCILVKAGANSNYAAFNISETLMVEQGSCPTEYDGGNGEYVATIGGKPIFAANANCHEKKYDIPLNTYILGDSTATYVQGLWPYGIASKFSFKNFYVLAKGGATWGVRKDATAATIQAGNNTDTANNNILTQVYKLIDIVTNNNAPTPELVVIHAGTNDVTGEFANGSTAMAGDSNYTEVGDADTTFDYSDSDYRDWSSIPLVDDRTNTAIGGMRLAIETIRTNWPYCKILVTTPIQRATNVSGDYSLLTVYRKCVAQIRKAAWYLGVPCLDLSAESGITVYNLSTFLSDGLHPNSAGGVRLADVIGRYLMAHYGFKKSWFS